MDRGVSRRKSGERQREQVQTGINQILKRAGKNQNRGEDGSVDISKDEEMKGTDKERLVAFNDIQTDRQTEPDGRR